MRFWSEGLGDRELVMGMDRAKLDRKPESLSLTGVVDSPAPWEYEVKMGFDDWQVILRTAARADTCAFIAKRADFATLLAIVFALARFVALLSGYRLARVLGFHHVAPEAPATR